MTGLIKKQNNENTTKINQKQIELGQWVWVKEKPMFRDESEWFGCVVNIGSNHIEIHEPSDGSSYETIRVHFNNLHKKVRFEENSTRVLQGKIGSAQIKISEYMEKIKGITSRLGVSKNIAIAQTEKHDSQALAVLSSTLDVAQYEMDLISAHEKELPELFKLIQDENKQLSKWMSAELKPLQAITNNLNGSMDVIKDRIFNVKLYAGLTENFVQCEKGSSARMTDKLHLMQRKLYMDEECLLSYKKGGIDIRGIEEFDRWLCVSENRDRILPFPRTITVLQVRRNEKERESRNLREALINIDLADLDKLTFFYIRNGEKIYRMNCDLAFDDLIFPDANMLDLSEPMMVKMRMDRVDSMVTVNEYDLM